MLRPRVSRKLSLTPSTLTVAFLLLPVSNFPGGRRASKRAVKKVETVNMGPENREPSRQTGYAASPLSSSSSLSKSELERHVAVMLKIKADHPEVSAVVQDTIDYMTGQHLTIEFLSVVPASIRSEVPTSIRSEVAALQSTSPSTGTFPSLNQITRLDSSVALVVNSKPKSKKNQAMGA